MHWNKRIVEQGLNFTVNVDFWFCNEKILKAKRVIRNGHFCPCPNSKGDILQKALTFFV